MKTAFLLTFAAILSTCMTGNMAYAAPRLSTFAAVVSCVLPDGEQGTRDDSSSQSTCCPPEQSSAQACLYAKYINPAIALLSVAVGLIVVIVLVFGAIEYVTSGGDPQRVAAAKSRIVNGLIALASFILLYAFLKFILPRGSS